MQKKYSVIAMATIGMALVIGLIGCNSKKEVFSATIDSPANYQYRIEVIDGCEYIHAWGYGYSYSGAMLTHKGNCKNPIHSYNIEKGN